MKDTPRTKRRRRIGALLGHMYHRANRRDPGPSLIESAQEQINTELKKLGLAISNDDAARAIRWDLTNLFLRAWEQGQREACELMKREGIL